MSSLLINTDLLRRTGDSRMTTDLIEVFAALAIVINVFLAGASVVLLGRSLIMGIFNVGAEPGFRIPDPFLGSGIGTLLLGVIFQIALLYRYPDTETIGFIIRLPTGLVNAIFLIAFTLLVLCLWIPRRLSYRNL